MSSRRELAVRTVFCTFFFGGDELATASLPPGRTPAFSGAAAGTSLPAGAAFEACVDSGVSAGGEAAAGASLRPKGSRAIAGLSTAFRIRTMRGLGAMADAGADVSLDLGGHVGGRLRPRGCAGVISRGWPRAHPRSGRCRAQSLARLPPETPWHADASAISIAARSEWRRAMTPETQSAPAMPPNSRETRRNAQLAA